MVVTSTNFIADVLYFIKNDLTNGVADPLTSRRPGSKFIMTSYPQRQVDYPLITIKLINQVAQGAGMQTEAMDLTFVVEVRVWARNQKEKDSISTAVYKRLRDQQYVTTTGSIANKIHDFGLLSSVEIDEVGQATPKSRIFQFQYRFFDV